MNHPPKLDRLIDELAKLPGIGKKTAKRLAFSILARPEREAGALSDAIAEAKENICQCEVCFSLTESPVCLICQNASRDHSILCIVEDPKNIFTIESSGIFSGVYHVLGGAISPLNGVGPENLSIRELQKRIAENQIKELILATNPTLEGEATAHYLTDQFSKQVSRVSRLARGMPIGGDLEYSDPNTLIRAFEGRTYY